MKDLIIVGAGSAAREYLQFIKEINNTENELKWNVKGFIADYGINIKELTNGEYDIIGTIIDWVPAKEENFICSISEPNAKKKVVELLEKKGAKFISLIHPTAKICDYAKVGKGLVMYPNSCIGVNATVGDFVTVDGSIAHDNCIGNYTTLSGGAKLSGYVTTGTCTFCGASSVVAPNVNLGDNSFICIGSVVIRNIRAGIKVIGNPAKRMDI